MDLLTFGFALDFDRQNKLMSTENNHVSAVQTQHMLKSILWKNYNIVPFWGPFDNKPIDSHILPLMVRDNHDSDNKRTIMELGHSVNDGVLNDIYLNTEYIFKHPSVDCITASLRSLGPAAMIYK